MTVRWILEASTETLAIFPPVPLDQDIEYRDLMSKKKAVIAMAEITNMTIIGVGENAPKSRSLYSDWSIMTSMRW